MGSSSLGVESASNEEHSEAVVVEPVEFLLDAAPALVQGAPSKADDKERAHHRRRGWEFLAGGGRGPGEPVHRDHLYPIAPRLGALRQPRFKRGFGAASIMSSNLAGPVPARTASSTATRTGHEPAAG